MSAGEQVSKVEAEQILSAGEQVSKHESEQILEGDNGVTIPWPRNGEQPTLTPSNYFIPTISAPASTAQATLIAPLNTTRKALDIADHGQGQNRALLEGLNRSAKKAESTLYKTNTGLFGFQRQGTMDLHDTSGSLLTPFGNTAEADVPGVGQSVGQTVSHGMPQTSSALGTQIAQNLSASQGMPQHVTQNGPQTLHASVTDGNQTVRVQASTGAPASSSGAPSQPQPIEVPKELRKPSRMPGTKQCPSCQGTIAAAVAKCPKCEHVFRPKKDKPKRSGKRGKKNCPKCSFENPSACSSCKNCKYVFRLKLMDRYKQMRPRTNENAATSAAVAHAATLHVQSQATAPQTISSTSLPMPSGVQQYQMSQPMHPSHSAIPPLPQHAMAVHHMQQHNVHQTNVQGLHPIPQHQLHPHQQHPQL